MGLTPAELMTVITATNVGSVEYVWHSARSRMTARERQLVEEVRTNLRNRAAAFQETEAPPPPWGKFLPTWPNKQPLSAADLMWLDRLPRDPAEVTEDQAKELAKISARVEPNTGDARLVETIFGPVRARFQTQATEGAVARQQLVAPPSPPSNAVAVLAEAIARTEAPAGLDEHGAYAFGNARASQLVNEGLARRDAAHEARLASIEARGMA